MNKSLEFFMVFSSAYQQFNSSVDGNLSIHGLSINEFMVLHQLHQATHTTMSRVDLASSVGLTASGITRLLNPLEKLHLVEKQAHARDARMSLVKLSSTGKKIYSDALKTCNHSAANFLRRVTEKQMTTLYELISKMA